MFVPSGNMQLDNAAWVPQALYELGKFHSTLFLEIEYGIQA